MVNGTLYNTGASSDFVCNIYDMAGNVSEWTTEHSTKSDWEEGSGTYYLAATWRGGTYSTTRPAKKRGSLQGGNNLNSHVGFRVGLYVL